MMVKLLIALAALTPAVAQAEAPAVPLPTQFQTRFDPLGPAVQSLPGANGRVVHYADTGEPGWRPVLFLGGTGTSARAMLMTGYLETLRKQLHLRLITVERDGFGDTAYTPGWQLSDYPADVRAVMDHLHVPRFAMVAISGGGPYAAHVAAAMPERLISLHFAAALADQPVGDGANCSASLDQLASSLAKTVDNPQAWWGYPPDSPTHAIPGFTDRAFDEGARTFFIRGQMGDARPEAAEMQRYCTAHLDRLPLGKVTAPVFTYYGLADHTVTLANAQFWKAHFPGPVTMRSYAGEGHDVQYRHWDQVLLDLSGHGDRTLLCFKGKARAVPAAQAPGLIHQGASEGLCLWRQ